MMHAYKCSGEKTNTNHTFFDLNRPRV